MLAAAKKRTLEQIVLADERRARRLVERHKAARFRRRSARIQLPQLEIVVWQRGCCAARKRRAAGALGCERIVVGGWRSLRRSSAWNVGRLRVVDDRVFAQRRRLFVVGCCGDVRMRSRY